MYNFPVAMDVIPNLSVSAVAVAGDLTLLGAVWLAASAIAFLLVIPLAARRHVTTTAVSESELPEAA